jgi:hypothetical protein
MAVAYKNEPTGSNNKLSPKYNFNVTFQQTNAETVRKDLPAPDHEKITEAWIKT